MTEEAQTENLFNNIVDIATIRHHMDPPFSDDQMRVIAVASVIDYMRERNEVDRFLEATFAGRFPGEDGDYGDDRLSAPNHEELLEACGGQRIPLPQGWVLVTVQNTVTGEKESGIVPTLND